MQPAPKERAAGEGEEQAADEVVEAATANDALQHVVARSRCVCVCVWQLPVPPLSLSLSPLPCLLSSTSFAISIALGQKVQALQFLLSTSRS